ncbi:MAG: transposase, partial [Cytophagales bacterium]|nr:transposase [Cytophagales bacterium]
SSSKLDPKKSVEYYQQRWKIEHCFKHLKSNGFALQEINLQEENKSQLMMAIIVFSYALSINQGLKQYQHISCKKYKNRTRYKIVSVFRKGLQEINQVCHIR